MLSNLSSPSSSRSSLPPLPPPPPLASAVRLSGSSAFSRSMLLHPAPLWPLQPTSLPCPANVSLCVFSRLLRLRSRRRRRRLCRSRPNRAASSTAAAAAAPSAPPPPQPPSPPRSHHDEGKRFEWLPRRSADHVAPRRKTHDRAALPPPPVLLSVATAVAPPVLRRRPRSLQRSMQRRR